MFKVVTRSEFLYDSDVSHTACSSEEQLAGIYLETREIDLGSMIVSR